MGILSVRLPSCRFPPFDFADGSGASSVGESSCWSAPGNLPDRRLSSVRAGGVFSGGSTSKGDDITEVGDIGPPLCEDGGGVGVDLAEGEGAPSCSFESKVEASDAAEGAEVGKATSTDGPDPVPCPFRLAFTGGARPSSLGLSSPLVANAIGWKSTSCTPVSVRLTSSERRGPLPPPSLPSLMRSRVGFMHRPGSGWRCG